MPEPVKIIKAGVGPSPAPKLPPLPEPPILPPNPPPAAARPRARKQKTMKTFPKGILKKTAKIAPVRDPAKPPPVKKGVRKHTVRVLTDKGVESRRKTIRSKIRKLKDEDVRAKLQKAGVSHNPKTPPHVLRDMLEGGVEAGMISLH